MLVYGGKFNNFILYNLTFCMKKHPIVEKFCNRAPAVAITIVITF